MWQYSKLVKCPLENQYFASYIAIERFILNTFVQLSLRDSNRLDEVRCSLTFDRSRFLNSPGLFTQMHIILHESVLSGHILLNKIFRFSLIFQTRLQKVDKIFRVL